MNIERYMGVVYPLVHRSKVTKRKLLKYVIYVSLFYLITLAISFFYNAVFGISASLIIVTFLSMTVFVYIRIFLAASKPKPATISDSDVANESSRGMSGEKTWRAFSKQIKLAKLCFLVVVCMFVCYMPLLFVRIWNLDDLEEKSIYNLDWYSSFDEPKSQLDHLLLENKMLRKEAKITLKIICGSKKQGVRQS